MECTKSNEKKNVFAQMIDLWKKDVNWNRFSVKDKKVCIWFGMSLVAMIVFGHTLLFIPAAISMVCSLGSLNKINVEE